MEGRITEENRPDFAASLSPEALKIDWESNLSKSE